MSPDPELVGRAMSLRASGLTYREVADRMRLSKSRAWDLVNDPNASLTRERKRRFDAKRGKQLQDRLFDL